MTRLNTKLESIDKRINDLLKEKEIITKKMGDKVLHHLIKNHAFEHDFKTLMNAFTFITTELNNPQSEYLKKWQIEERKTAKSPAKRQA